MSMTWLNEYRATPGRLLASSAICCRFVYRFVGFSVPSHVSHQQFSFMASPFSPPGPFGQVPRLHRYYGDATPSCIAHRSLMISPRSFRASSVSCIRLRAPVGPEKILSGQGHFDAGFPHSGFFTRSTQDFSGSLLAHPMPLPCSKTPAGSKCPRQSGPLDAAPASNAAKAPAHT